MAKRLTQPSLKITKKQPTHQFNSLIKVLKPKVFIIDSSNFKTLVQELTDNGSQSLAPSSFYPPPTTRVVSPEPVHVIQIDDHDSHDPSLDHVVDFSVINPADNMFIQCDYSNCTSEELGIQLSHLKYDSLDSSPDSSLDPSPGCSSNPSSDNKFMQFDHYSNCSSEELRLQWSQDRDVNIEIELRNFESWLLDFDSSVCSHDVPFVPMSTYEYGYNLPPSIM